MTQKVVNLNGAPNETADAVTSAGATKTRRSGSAKNKPSTVRENLKRFFADHPGFNAYNTADRMGVGQTTLNQFINDKYPGDNKGVAKKIAQFLRSETVRDQVNVTLEPVITRAFSQIMGALYLAQDTRGIVVIGGEPGVGKTFAIDQFLQENEGTPLVVNADPSYFQPFGFFCQAVFEQTGVIPSYRLVKAKIQFEKMFRGTNRTLLVNDAHCLSYQTLDHLAAIAERQQIAVGLLGHTEIIGEIQQAAKRSREYWERLDSRVEYLLVDSEITRTEARQFADQIVDNLTDDGLDVLADPAFCRTARDLVRTCLIFRRWQLDDDAMRADGANLRAAAKIRRAPSLVEIKKARRARHA